MEPRAQCFVKRDYRPVFTEDTMPRLAYVSRRPPVEEPQPWLLHAHPDLAEVLLFDQGGGRFLIGGTAYDVHAGDLMVINSGLVHDELSNGPFGLFCIAVSGLRIPGLRENALLPEGAPPVFPAGEEAAELQAVFQLIYRYLRDDLPDCEIFCHRLMLALLDRVLTISGSTTLRLPESPDPAALSHQVQGYIDGHFREPLTLQSLGKALHVSPYYLAHVFKESSGYSPMHYLTRRRIGEAQNLLVSTDLPISRISEMVGYETQNYFNQQFSKYAGMPPGKFRQSMAAKKGGDTRSSK